jgi:hypothetical protein
MRALLPVILLAACATQSTAREEFVGWWELLSVDICNHLVVRADGSWCEWWWDQGACCSLDEGTWTCGPEGLVLSGAMLEVRTLTLHHRNAQGWLMPPDATKHFVHPGDAEEDWLLTMVAYREVRDLDELPPGLMGCAELRTRASSRDRH